MFSSGSFRERRRRLLEPFASIAQIGRNTLTNFVARLRTANLRQHASVIFLTAGAVLSLYVGGTYFWTFHQQRELMQEWRAQNSTARASSSAKETRLIRLVIPKIKLDAVILDDLSHRSLTLGPGHLKASALPGDAGNSVIAAHRDTFFRNLNELRQGDDVFVERDGKKFHYVVTGKQVVQPDDISVLDATSDTRLTLITCYPTYYIGPAPERLIVFARLVEHA